jgi:LacI family transcriptional regulator
MATIKDVSELAGVSQATVSRVINGTTHVDEEKKQRVLAAIKKLGYRPNAHAKSLASNRSNSIGMVVSELAGPYFGEMMAGAESVIRKNNKQMLIASSHANDEIEKDVIEFLVSCRCDALILHAETLSDDYLLQLKKQNIELVLLNRFVKGIDEHCFILDNEKGGFLATEHLIQQGCHHIACILGPQWKHDARERFEGYLKALKKYRLPFDPQLIVEGDFQEAGGREGIAKLVAREQTIDGLFCANDEMALGAMSWLLEQGFKVPDEIKIVGFDNIAYTRYVTPQLSSVHFPIRKIAQDAAWLVMQRVYQISPPHEIERNLTPELIVRASSRGK